MVTSKRMLLGLLVFGVLGMHVLVTGPCATPAHDVPMPSLVLAQDADTGHPPGSATEHGTGHHAGATLALCVALLLSMAVAAAAGRRTTWVSAVDRALRRLSGPSAPVLRAHTPVSRFTVMRC